MSKRLWLLTWQVEWPYGHGKSPEHLVFGRKEDALNLGVDKVRGSIPDDFAAALYVAVFLRGHEGDIHYCNGIEVRPVDFFE